MVRELAKRRQQTVLKNLQNLWIGLHHSSQSLELKQEIQKLNNVKDAYEGMNTKYMHAYFPPNAPREPKNKNRKNMCAQHRPIYI